MRAGFAKVDITPDLDRQKVFGLGYWFQRSIRFTGVRDPLFVRCAAIGQGRELCFIISVDSTLDSFGFCPGASARITRQFNIPLSQVFIHCTHTHSAPLSGMNGKDDVSGYGRMVEDRIVESAVQATRNQHDITVSLAQTRVSGILYNRRPLLADGTIAELHGSLESANIADPGPINDTMTLIRFHDSNSRLIGALCHFGIHGVCIQCSDLISGDCMGQAIQRIEHDLHDQSCIVFLNGPCGDIDPLAMGDEKSLEKTAECLHKQIAKLTQATGHSILLEPKYFAAGTFHAQRRVTRPASELVQLQAALKSSAARETDPKHHSGPGYELFLLEEERQLSLLPDEIGISYSIFHLGDLTLVGLAGEIFTEFGLALAATLDHPHLFVVGLTGGWNGYLPPASAYTRGGYEVTPSRWSRVAPGETERLFDHLCKEFTKWRKD